MSDPQQPPGPPQPPQPPRQLAVKLDEHIAQGTYANFAMVTHGEAEFILDFLFIQPGRDEARVNSRVILSPLQAKRLLAALGDNVNHFEQRFGTIPLQAKGTPAPDGTMH